MKVDQTDKKILELLSINGRMSYVDIGKELGLSRVAVRERVNQMMEKGIIEKFSVVINSEAVGKTVSAFFEVDCERDNKTGVLCGGSETRTDGTVAAW
ncbi:AsnC family transcriptional regulator [Bacillus sp. IB182487]|uniref:AsnC family transcriptional regulator n=1 Tax=Metabacillus arenae TaxID=2771434 RepID=A0A926RWR9_9BACI|nr:AsnC family transcriptional regulator [Metabacillus arenae]